MFRRKKYAVYKIDTISKQAEPHGKAKGRRAALKEAADLMEKRDGNRYNYEIREVLAR